MRDDVTDARLAWNTWRRILTSDALVEAVTRPGGGDPAALGLGADELAVLAEYASSPVATDVNVGMFRRGLSRNALSALKLVPLTRRLLHTSGLDVPTVTAAFVRSAHYRDDGPYFWRTAAAFVEFLAGLPAFAPPVRQDVIAVDRAAIALMRRLGEAPPAVWPDDAAGAPRARAGTRYLASTAATVASTDHDLTSWLENPSSFAVDAELERGPRHWLISVPSAVAAFAYAELSERAARAFESLATPRSAAELEGLAAADALEVLDSLIEIGAVIAVDDRATG